MPSARILLRECVMNEYEGLLGEAQTGCLERGGESKCEQSEKRIKPLKAFTPKALGYLLILYFLNTQLPEPLDCLNDQLPLLKSLPCIWLNIQV